MNNKKSCEIVILSTLLTTGGFSMEYVSLVESANNNQAIEIVEAGPINPTSSEILGKSLAFGVIDGAITESGQMLENLLYNAFIQKGPEAATFVAEELGKHLGDQGGKFAIKLAVTKFFNAVTSSNKSCENSLLVQTAFVELHGLILGSILRKLDESIAEAKKDLSQKAADTAKELLNNKLRKDNETKDQKAQRKLISFIAEDSAYYATHKGLDTAEKILKTRGQAYIEDFISESKYADKLTCASKYLTDYRDAEHEIEHISAHSDSLVNNQLSIVPKVSSYLGGLAGSIISKLTGNYIFEKSADTYILGISQHCVDKIKQSRFMKNLENYKNISKEVYLEILEREIVLEEKAKKAQAEKEELYRLLAEEAAREHALMIQREQDYEQAYVNHYGKKRLTIYDVMSAPIAATKYVGDTIYNGGCKILNGALNCASFMKSGIQYLLSESTNTMYRNLSPQRMNKLGYAIAGKIAEDIFLKIIQKGNLYPHLNQDQIISILHTKKSNKDTFSYRVCDNIVWGSNIVTEFIGTNNKVYEEEREEEDPESYYYLENNTEEI